MGAKLAVVCAGLPCRDKKEAGYLTSARAWMSANQMPEYRYSIKMGGKGMTVGLRDTIEQAILVHWKWKGRRSHDAGTTPKLNHIHNQTLRGVPLHHAKYSDFADQLICNHLKFKPIHNFLDAALVEAGDALSMIVLRREYMSRHMNSATSASVTPQFPRNRRLKNPKGTYIKVDTVHKESSDQSSAESGHPKSYNPKCTCQSSRKSPQRTGAKRAGLSACLKEPVRHNSQDKFSVGDGERPESRLGIAQMPTGIWYSASDHMNAVKNGGWLMKKRSLYWDM